MSQHSQFRCFPLYLTCFLVAFIPFDSQAQSCPIPPASAAEDCNANGVKDSCDSGPGSFVIFDGGLLGVPSNDCKVDGVPDDCTYSCYQGISSVDADGDGTSNCQEIWDETDPCDSGSRITRLNPRACGSPNGFFGQVNIATVINTSFQNLNVKITYFDSAGASRGAASRTLQSNQKWDVIVNELGLEPDTYGTVCVETGGSVQGLWTGGLTIYKLREDNAPFGEGSEFDFALYYPFTNAKRGAAIIPVNTNFPLEASTSHTVANWIRLIDAAPGDSQSLRGTLRYFNNGGGLVSSVAVNIPDGGRNDFGAHAALGANAVGFAEFTPESTTADYYIEATRYFYEGVGAASTKFYAAFPIAVQPLSGAGKSAPVDTNSNEFSVVEILNGTAAPLTGANAAALQVYGSNGATVFGTQGVEVPAKGTAHKIVSGTPQTATDTSLAQVSGPAESLNETAFVYGFGGGSFLYGYSTPMVESPGPRQVTEFNTFIGHENTLKLLNASDASMKVSFTIFDFAHNQLALPAALDSVTLAPRESRQVTLSDLPRDNYGTIVARAAQGKVGLIMVNNISRPNAYVMPFVAR